MRNRLFKFFAALMVAGMFAFTSEVASAAGVYNVTTLNGSQGFFYDPDRDAPTVTADGFYASGLTSNSDYNSIRFTPSAIGMSNLTLGQITAFSYEAKNAVAGMKDWRVKVYTEVQGDSISDAWYGARIEGPTTISSTDWTFHNINAYDRFTWGGTGGGNYYASNPNFMAQVMAAAGHKVLFFDIIAGANSGGHNYDTYLNNIQISATGFGTSTIQAAVVPLPAALPAGLALFGLVVAKRKFGKRQQA